MWTLRNAADQHGIRRCGNCKVKESNPRYWRAGPGNKSAEYPWLRALGYVKSVA